MNKYLNERVGLACIISVFAGVALTNLGIGETTAACIIWLAFAVACGVVVNTQKGLTTIQILQASVLPTGALLATVLYRLIFHNIGSLSGVPWRPDLFGAIFLGCIGLASFLGIWIFAHSRRLLLAFLKAFFGMSERKAEKIENRIKWLTSFIGSLILLYGAVFL